MIKYFLFFFSFFIDGMEIEKEGGGLPQCLFFPMNIVPALESSEKSLLARFEKSYGIEQDGKYYYPFFKKKDFYSVQKNFDSTSFNTSELSEVSSLKKWLTQNTQPIFLKGGSPEEVKKYFSDFTSDYIACNSHVDSSKEESLLRKKEQHLVDLEENTIVDGSGLNRFFSGNYVDFVEYFYTYCKKFPVYELRAENICEFSLIENFFSQSFFNPFVRKIIISDFFVPSRCRIGMYYSHHALGIDVLGENPCKYAMKGENKEEIKIDLKELQLRHQGNYQQNYGKTELRTSTPPSLEDVRYHQGGLLTETALPDYLVVLLLNTIRFEKKIDNIEQLQNYFEEDSDINSVLEKFPHRVTAELARDNKYFFEHNQGGIIGTVPFKELPISFIRGLSAYIDCRMFELLYGNTIFSILSQEEKKNIDTEFYKKIFSELEPILVKNTLLGIANYLEIYYYTLLFLMILQDKEKIEEYYQRMVIGYLYSQHKGDIELVIKSIQEIVHDLDNNQKEEVFEQLDSILRRFKEFPLRENIEKDFDDLYNLIRDQDKKDKIKELFFKGIKEVIFVEKLKDLEGKSNFFEEQYSPFAYLSLKDCSKDTKKVILSSELNELLKEVIRKFISVSYKQIFPNNQKISEEKDSKEVKEKKEKNNFNFLYNKTDFSWLGFYTRTQLASNFDIFLSPNYEDNYYLPISSKIDLIDLIISFFLKIILSLIRII
jgi:hypothetical protein